MSSDTPRPSASRSTRGVKKPTRSGKEARHSPPSSSGRPHDRLYVPSRDRVKTHSRQPSDQSLKLDLHGLDLGGDAGPSSNPFRGEIAFPPDIAAVGAASPFDAHLRSHSGGQYFTTSRSPMLSGSPFMHRSSSEDVIGRMSFATQAGGPMLPEDSFAMHLRSECTDFNEIMPSSAILSGEADGGVDAQQTPRQHYSAARSPAQQQQQDHQQHGRFNQVLGGFASLGVSGHGREPSALRQSRHKWPLHSAAGPTGSDSRSPDLAAAATAPLEAAEGHGGYFRHDELAPSSYRWAYLAPQPCDPLKVLDVLSIEEMGLHSFDVGNLNDWDGHIYESDFVCPHSKRVIKIAWSVATSFKRQKKWIVVPGSFCNGSQLSSDDQGYRTVVVSDRQLLSAADGARDASATRSPFTRAGFELGFLRKPSGTFSSTVLLARRDVHRMRLAQQRLRAASAAQRGELDSCPTSPGALSVHSEPKILPFYPVLRRSRSRPYIRDHAQTLSRSRSGPYLKPSDGGGSDATDHFAPSLPGAPGAQYQPVESWPSARAPASPMGSIDSSCSSSGTHTSHSSVGPVTTSYSQASTRGMLEAPVSESIRSKTSLASPASPRTPSSAGLQGQNGCLFPQSVSPFEAGQSASRLASADATSSPIDLSPGTLSPKQPASISDELDRRSQHDAAEQLQQLQLQRTRAENHGALSVDTACLARVRTAESVTPGNIVGRGGWMTAAAASTFTSASASAAAAAAARQTSAVPSQAQRKDRRIGGWFKKRVGASQSISSSSARALSPPALANPDPLADQLQEEQVLLFGLRPRPNRAMALTRKALEQIEALVERPASPESTIMGSRRGSACVVGHSKSDTSIYGKATASQRYEGGTVEPADSSAASLLPLAQKGTDGLGVWLPSPPSGAAAAAPAAPPLRLNMTKSRAAVNASLACIYGWTDNESRILTDTSATVAPLCLAEEGVPFAASTSPKLRQPLPRTRNTEDENALLGLDRVSADALTMLIPLPLIGRPSDMPASRYMRITFTPFGDPTPTSECSGSTSDPDSGSTDRELATNPVGARAVPAGARHQGAADRTGSGHSSSWYRRLGFASSSRHSGQASSSSRAAKEAAAAAAATTQRCCPPRTRTLSGAMAAPSIESFKIAGQVLDALDVDHNSNVVNARIPRAGSFPVVLGFCDGRRGLELVSEGFEALGLIGGCDRLVVQDADDCPPLAGVSDMIIAACAAIIDV